MRVASRQPSEVRAGYVITSGQSPGASPSLFPRAAMFPGAQFGEWVLRGIGLVVLQANPVSGGLILAAILLNSLPYGIACAVGTAIGTLAAVVLGADRGMVREGLYGFNA